MLQLGLPLEGGQLGWRSLGERLCSLEIALGLLDTFTRLRDLMLLRMRSRKQRGTRRQAPHRLALLVLTFNSALSSCIWGSRWWDVCGLLVIEI